jgi:hypothetical protein
MPELGAALGGAVDLVSNQLDIGHVSPNEVTRVDIP